jgi:ribonuclease HII
MRNKFDPSVIPPSPDLSFERSLWLHEIRYVAGIDEAGRGAWAGPVYAAAVVLPCELTCEFELAGVRDSKQLTPQKRSQLALIVKKFALAYAVAFADVSEVDAFGIMSANRLAMMRAVNALCVTPEYLLIDALFLPDMEQGQTSLIKGDQRSLSIAAASILAKTERDAWMIAAYDKFQDFRFDQHKGYGTRLHQTELSNYGTCELHRKTYKPIRDMLDKEKA